MSGELLLLGEAGQILERIRAAAIAQSQLPKRWGTNSDVGNEPHSMTYAPGIIDGTCVSMPERRSFPLVRR